MDSCSSSRQNRNRPLDTMHGKEGVHGMHGNGTTSEGGDAHSNRYQDRLKDTAPRESALEQNSSQGDSNIFRGRKEVCVDGCDSSNPPSWLSRTLCTKPSLEDVVDIEKSSSASQIDSRSDVETYERFCSRREDDRYSIPSKFTFEIDEVIEDQIEVRPTLDAARTYEERVVDSSLDSDIYDASINYDDPGVSLILHDNDKCTAISNLLEGNGYMCSGLEKWYESDESGFTVVDDEDECDTPHNRSCNISNRKKRIERLQMNLTPFEVDDVAFIKGSINTTRYSPVELQNRARSFSLESPTSVVVDKKVPSSTNYHCYGYQNLPSCGNSKARNTALVDWDENDDEDLCYDSDPSDFMPSRQSTKTPSKRGRRDTKLLCERFDEETMPTILSSKTLLIWHRPARSYIVGMNADPPTMAVRAWIEQGSHIQGGLIQPKLMWQETCGKETKASDGSRSILNTMNFHAVELLDISKVVPMLHVNREFYPFAKKSCCFIVEAYEKEMIFEAETIAQRDEIIHGLKVLVARLGSKIIVGDRDVLHEFFSPMGTVPGEAPAILTEGIIET